MKKLAFLLSLIIIISSVGIIAFADGVICEPAIAAGYGHTVALNKYGRVFSAGDNSFGQCATYGWEDVVQICAGKYFSAALHSNGTVSVAGTDDHGNAIDVSGFSDIVQIAAGDSFVAALDKDGFVYTAGNTDGTDTSQWTDIKKIACGKKHIVGLKENGKCEGSGGEGANVDTFADITEIYAGANLTVVKDSSGKLYYTGMAIQHQASASNEDMELKWLGSEWTDVKDISITADNNGRGIVTAVFENGDVRCDKDDNVEWSTDFDLEGLSGVKSIAVRHIRDTLVYAVVLYEDYSVDVMGQISQDFVKNNNWKEETAKFDVIMKPLSDFTLKDPQVLVGYKTVGIVLPGIGVKTFGSTYLNGFDDIKFLSSTKVLAVGKNTDTFIGIDSRGSLISNTQISIPDDKKDGILKLDLYDNSFISLLRWDKRVYNLYLKQTTSDEGFLKYGGITDICTGNLFTAVLNEEGSVFTDDKQGVSIDTEGFENIKIIAAGNDHVVGIKNDGTCMAAGRFNNNSLKVDGWKDIVDVVCGNGFTVGLKSDGSCLYAGDNEDMKAAVELWTGVKSIYSSKICVVAYKKDGTFTYYSTSERPDFEGLKNVYTDGKTFFLYHKAEGDNAVSLECYSDKKITGFAAFYDDDNNLKDVSVISLDTKDKFSSVKYTCDSNAKKYKIFIWDNLKPIYMVEGELS